MFKLYKCRVCYAMVVILATCAHVTAAQEFRVEFDQVRALNFEADGDVIVPYGWVVPQARLHVWTSELRPRDEVKEFIVRIGGNVVAMMDESRQSLYLRGTVTTGVATLAQNPSLSELVVRSNGVARAVIDPSGNLRIRGGITQGYCAEQREDLVAQYDDLGYDYFDQYFGAVQCYKLVNNWMYINPGSFSFDALSCNHDALPRNHGNWQWDETVSRMYQAVANQYGAAINVTSGFRCPTKNNDVPGASNDSKHVYGRAFDFAHPTAQNPSTQANWLIAVAAASQAVGVPTDRIFLYSQINARRTYADFLANGWNWQNLPPGWTAITHGHCDSGQPANEPR